MPLTSNGCFPAHGWISSQFNRPYLHYFLVQRRLVMHVCVLINATLFFSLQLALPVSSPWVLFYCFSPHFSTNRGR